MKTQLLLILLFCSTVLRAQEWQHPYFAYTTSDGLPSNLVYGSLMDKDGLLWICTDGGVVQFDGAASKVYTTWDGLPSNDVYHMFCDSKNRIWFTTLKNEISYYYNGKIHNQRNDTLLAKIKTNATFPRVYEDYKGNIWINYTPTDLFKITNGQRILTFKSDEGKFSGNLIFLDSLNLYLISRYFTTKIGIETNRISSTEAKRQNQIFSTKANRRNEILGLTKYNSKILFLKENGKIYETIEDSVNLAKFCFTGRNNFLRKFNSRIFTFNQDGFEEVLNIFPDLRKKYLRGIPISDINVDINELIWASTFSNGCMHVVSNKNLIFKVPSNIKSKSINTVKVIDNLLLLGTSEGEIIVKDLKNETTIYSDKIFYNSVSNYRTLSFEKERDKLIILLDNKVAVFSLNKLSYKILEIPEKRYAAFKNIYKRDSQFLLLFNLGVFVYNYKDWNLNAEFLNNKRAYSYVNYKGKEVVGTQDSLMLLDKEYKPYPLNKPFSKRIMDLQTNDTLLFAVTSENGLYIINDQQVIKNINTVNGLSSNNCFKCKLYNNKLFIATDKGINVVDYKNFKVQYIYESDGLPSNTVNDICIDKDTLYAATEAGLSMMPLKDINLDKSFKLITKPYIIEKDTFWNKPHKIVTHTNKKITCILHGLSFIRNTKKTYVYRIPELDTTYTSTLDKNIIFSIPKPGNYTFEAYALNAEGTKSLALIIPITIEPYFYQTFWFKLLVIASIIMLILTIGKWLVARTKRIEQQKLATEKRIQKLELAAWKSSINPHFLFNSLNTLQGLFRMNQFERANDFMSNFTVMLRRTMDFSNKLFVNVGQEVTYLDSYLAFEKVKRNNEFQYSVEVQQPEIDSYFIPSLVIQPIVENSIKHAMRNRKNGCIKVKFYLQGDFLICDVFDNGSGMPPDKIIQLTSKGLSLVKNKLSIVEGVINQKIDFIFNNQINENNGQVIGFLTRFTFPILKTSAYDKSDNH